MPGREGTLGRIRSKHVTRAYTEQYEQTDMARKELDRYCAGCGLLPAWCNCGSRVLMDNGGTLLLPGREDNATD